MRFFSRHPFGRVEVQRLSLFPAFISSPVRVPLLAFLPNHPAHEPGDGNLLFSRLPPRPFKIFTLERDRDIP
jgi:hypothetical protein